MSQIPIIDAAIGHPLNATDRVRSYLSQLREVQVLIPTALCQFDVYDKGHELGVWMRNPDGTEYVGAVWPTFAVFPGISLQILSMSLS